jgi:hypothetical protein
MAMADDETGKVHVRVRLTCEPNNRMIHCMACGSFNATDNRPRRLYDLENRAGRRRLDDVPVWAANFGARGTFSLVKDAKTHEPMLQFRPAHEAGSMPPKSQLYRITF